MAALLLGLLLGLSNREYVRIELMYLGAGIVVFYAGYLLERGAGRR